MRSGARVSECVRVSERLLCCARKSECVLCCARKSVYLINGVCVRPFFFSTAMANVAFVIARCV